MSRADGGTGSFDGSASRLPLEQARLVDETCDGFEAEWRAGNRPDIEAAVQKLPEVLRPAALRELVAVDVFYRRKAGEAPTAGDYAARFPDLDPDWLAGAVAGEIDPGGWTGTLGGAGPPGAPAELPSVPGFEILGELDRGGMGVVYRARQAGLNREVALKMLLAGAFAAPVLRARFLVEAESVAALEHPHIVRVFAFGESGRHPYLAMEYLPGGTLAARIKAGGPVPAREAAGLVTRLAEAAAHAHSRGVVHRDIKPHNVLFGADGEPRLADFGLAKVGRADRNLSISGQVLGTPAYMAPEQAAGKVREVGTAADVYALGAVLYDALTGRPPFLGDSHAVTLQKVIAEEPARPRAVNPAVPRDLETVCLKCLEKEPAKRYATAQALADELGRYLRGEPVEARRAGRLERAYKWVRRNRAAAALAASTALLLLSAVGGGVALAYSRTLEGKNRDLEFAKGEAEERRGEADAQRGEAERQKVEADKQRAKAREEEARARRYLYVSRMTLAQQAEREGKPARVLQLLRSVVPDAPGHEDLRGWEWHHLWRKHNGEDALLRGHDGEVTGVAVSPDGRLLASSGTDGTVRLWDARGGSPVRVLAGHTGRVTGVAFGRDGRVLVSGGQDGTLRWWDPDTGREVGRADHDKPVAALAVSRDGAHLACASGQSVLVYGPGGGRPASSRSHTGPVTGVAFSPDGAAVASVTLRSAADRAQGQAVVWGRASGDLLCTLPGREGRTAVAFSPDGGQVAVCEADGHAVSVHDARTGRLTVRLTGHTAPPLCVSFDPTGTQVAAGGRDGTVRVWEAEGGKPVRDLHDGGPVGAVAFSPDGSRLVSGCADGTIKFWPPGAARTLMAAPRVRSVAFSPDGGRLAVAGSGPALVFDVASGARVAALPGQASSYTRLAWSPDGALIGGAEGYGLWNAATGAIGRRLAAVPGGTMQGAGTAFSADGRYFAAVSSDTAVQVWEVGTGRPVYRYDVPGKGHPLVWPVAVAFHPGGRLLAVAVATGNWLSPGRVEVADVAAGQVVRTIGGFTDSAFDVAFSPDGRLLAAAVGATRFEDSGSAEVRVWEAATGREVFVLRGHTEAVFSLSFSPDGRRLVSGGSRWQPDQVVPGEVRVWDMTTGEQVFESIGAPGDALGVAFSPCGRFLAKGGKDGLVTVLDGTPVAQTPAHRPLPGDHDAKP